MSLLTHSPRIAGLVGFFSAKDLIADKMKANGPRGVAYGDPTAGEPLNEDGRLPRYTTLGRRSGPVRMRVSADPGNRVTVVIKE